LGSRKKKQNSFFRRLSFWANFGWGQNLPDNLKLVSKTKKSKIPISYNVLRIKEVAEGNLGEGA